MSQITKYTPDKKKFAERMEHNLSLVNLPNVSTMLESLSDASFILNQSNLDALRASFGEPDGCFRHEYNKYYWQIQFSGEIFTIFSGAGFGSAYEIRVSEEVDFKRFRESAKYQRLADNFFAELLTTLKPAVAEKLQHFHDIQQRIKNVDSQ